MIWENVLEDTSFIEMEGLDYLACVSGVEREKDKGESFAAGA